MKKHKETKEERAEHNRKIGETNSKLKPDIIEKLKEMYKLDASQKEMACYLEVCEETICHWKKKHPLLFQSLELMRNEPILTARRTIVKAVATETPTAFKYLERKARKEFLEEQKIIVETDDEERGGDVKAAVEAFEQSMRKILTTKKDEQKTDKE
jgi:DNA-binding transcriptional regulator YiaG